jgi:uncharacterized protein Usg
LIGVSIGWQGPRSVIGSRDYVWQDYDLCPAFPALNKFLNFWLETLEGPLHSVTVAHARLIKPAEIRAIDGEFRLH